MLPLPVAPKYAREAAVAHAAVLRAAHITRSVQATLAAPDSETKLDKSPVTVADYASQALIGHLLSRAFPADALVGEEDTTSLRAEGEPARVMRGKIVALVNEALALEGDAAMGEKGGELSEEQVLEAIDLGKGEGGREGRWWTCDPIDGTLGFLRGEQYAICLTLVEASVPVLGLIACPNLPFPSVSSSSTARPANGTGSLFIASTAHGSHQGALPSSSSSTEDTTFHPIHLPPTPTPPYSILESVEASHSSHTINSSISSSLGGLGARLRMDSQAKYGALARGDASLYLRVPTRYQGGKVYEEKIWDHASGWVLIKEAGGEVRDCWGRELDFGRGRTLKGNDGVIASASGLSAEALRAVRAAILAANPGMSPPDDVAQSVVEDEAVQGELQEAREQGEGVETGKGGVVVAEEMKAPTS